MRVNNFNPQVSAAAMNTSSAPDDSRIVWGFMFENTLFTEFERRNHPIIEAAYRQRKKKHTSHHITIVDANLPKPGKAKVYFGVAQNHLRMPGTRYYVNRQVIKSSGTSISEASPRPPAINTTKTNITPNPPVSSPYSLPMMIPSPTSTFSSSSFSSLDTSFLYPNEYSNFMGSSQQQQMNANTLAVVLSDDLPLVDFNNNINCRTDAPVQNDHLFLDTNYSSNYNNSCYLAVSNSSNLQQQRQQQQRVNNYNVDLTVSSTNNNKNKCNCYYSSNTNSNMNSNMNSNNNFSSNNNMCILEDPEWVEDFVSLGLLPTFPDEIPWFSTAYKDNYFNMTTNDNTTVNNNSLFYL